MFRLRVLTTAVLLVPASVGAGGLDQSGQPVTALFAEGRRLEVSWGRWLPELSGTGPTGRDTGNAYGPLTGAGASLRFDIAPHWTGAVILDRPFGVVVGYDTPYAESDFPYAGTQAAPESHAITGLIRYLAPGGFGIHGGLRAIRFNTDVHLDGPGFGPLAGYDWQAGDDWGIGAVIGGSWEKPEIALRVALTYSSEAKVEAQGVESLGPRITPDAVTLRLPQSVNLDVQTGIAPGTLLYGSVRWADWGGFKVAPPVYTGVTGNPLVEFSHDTFTYRLGLGHRFGERWSAAVEMSHEAATGEKQTALTPYDGYTSVGLGLAYTTPSGVELAGGAAWYALGDAKVDSFDGVIGDFRDNHALGLGLKLSYAF